MPPGKRSLGSGGEDGTTSSYVDTQTSSGHLANGRAWVLCAVLLWCSIFVGEHFAHWAVPRWVSVAVLLFSVPVYFARVLHGAVVCVVVCLAGLTAGAASWHITHAVPVGLCSGVATLRSDPELFSAGTSVVIELDGRRYRGAAFGMAGKRLAQRFSGESIVVSGRCENMSGPYARRDRIRHIVGKMSIEAVSENFAEGSSFIRAANRIRGVIAGGVQEMSPENRSLFLGLVIGDDRAQSPEMVQRFRDSGLSHLCAVSGQNVAFLLMLLRPFTTRRHRIVGWAITVVVIAWFVVVTRAEPSIVRASVMATLVATSSLFGKQLRTSTVLAVTVCGLLLIDPMLAWSIGFGLSVAATGGLIWLSAPCARLLGGSHTIASTCAAQIGTTPLSLFVFGTAPVVSLLANPFAIPVAGVVMTVGLPLAVFSFLFPSLAEPVAAVLTVPVAWVDAVSRAGAQVSPSGFVNALMWGCLGGVIVWRHWRHTHIKSADDASGVAG